jgi:hypothetical protein
MMMSKKYIFDAFNLDGKLVGTGDVNELADALGISVASIRNAYTRDSIACGRFTFKINSIVNNITNPRGARSKGSNKKPVKSVIPVGEKINMSVARSNKYATMIVKYSQGIASVVANQFVDDDRLAILQRLEKELRNDAIKYKRIKEELLKER